MRKVYICVYGNDIIMDDVKWDHVDNNCVVYVKLTLMENGSSDWT